METTPAFSSISIPTRSRTARRPTSSWGRRTSRRLPSRPRKRSSIIRADWLWMQMARCSFPALSRTASSSGKTRRCSATGLRPTASSGRPASRRWRAVFPKASSFHPSISRSTGKAPSTWPTRATTESSFSETRPISPARCRPMRCWVRLNSIPRPRRRPQRE